MNAIEGASPLPVPALPPAEDARLDELMLAMDVVDTLRHDQALIEAELDAEDRERRFVARLKEIYAGQGIEVSDAIIAEGVAALKQDRFRYEPPPPGLALSLARIWIDRGKWGRRALVALLIAGLGYGAVTVPARWFAEREYRGYVAAVDATRGGALGLSERIDALRRELAAARADLPALAAALATSHQTAAEAQLEQAAGVAAELAAATVGPAPAAGAYAADPAAAERNARRLAARLAEGQRAAEAASAAIARLRETGALARRATQVRARLDAVGLSAAALAAVEPLWRQAEAAFSAADGAAAAAAVARLEQLDATARLEYELRIVSRPDQRSGIWREAIDDPRQRNYYLIVEAIAPDGAALALPILNEETQRTETVRIFALRVTPERFERVRTDKLDNGLIDDAVIGVKRRGELEPEYRIELAGGAITRW